MSRVSEQNEMCGVRAERHRQIEVSRAREQNGLSTVR